MRKEKRKRKGRGGRGEEEEEEEEHEGEKESGLMKVAGCWGGGRGEQEQEVKRLILRQELIKSEHFAMMQSNMIVIMIIIIRCKNKRITPVNLSIIIIP